MKKLIFLVILTLVASPLWAHECGGHSRKHCLHSQDGVILRQSSEETEDVLLSGDIVHGGFGGPVVKFTQIDEDFAVFTGGRGGWIINHRFILGGGGYGVANDIEFDDPNSDKPLYMDFGYGGLEMEYVFSPKKLFHFSVQGLIGAGGLSLDYTKHTDDHWDDDGDDDDVESEAVFVAEPGINAIVNVTNFFRVGIGGSYRMVSSVDSKIVSASDLSGPSGHIVLKFGKF
jgi:hypothetical protein